MAENLQVGDVVQLNSGGPLMTATHVEEDEISTTWFEGANQLYGNFDKKTLRKKDLGGPSSGPVLA